MHLAHPYLLALLTYIFLSKWVARAAWHQGGRVGGATPRQRGVHTLQPCGGLHPSHLDEVVSRSVTPAIRTHLHRTNDCEMKCSHLPRTYVHAHPYYIHTHKHTRTGWLSLLTTCYTDFICSEPTTWHPHASKQHWLHVCCGHSRTQWCHGPNLHIQIYFKTSNKHPYVCFKGHCGFHSFKKKSQFEWKQVKVV